MSEAPLLARLHDRPGALERAIALMRRRAHRIHRISVASTPDSVELVLRVDQSRTSRERVERDLLSLEDLIDVRHLDGAAPTRELLLAWIRSDAAPHAGGNSRIVAVSADHSLLEATGTPAEIDTLLARLDAVDAVITSVRSGEVAAPMNEPSTDVGNSEAGPRNTAFERAAPANP